MVCCSRGRKLKGEIRKKRNGTWWKEVEGRKKGEKEYNLALGRKGTYGIATSNR